MMFHRGIVFCCASVAQLQKQIGFNALGAPIPGEFMHHLTSANVSSRFIASPPPITQKAKVETMTLRRKLLGG